MNDKYSEFTKKLTEELIGHSIGHKGQTLIYRCSLFNISVVFSVPLLNCEDAVNYMKILSCQNIAFLAGFC